MNVTFADKESKLKKKMENMQRQINQFKSENVDKETQIATQVEEIKSLKKVNESLKETLRKNDLVKKEIAGEKIKSLEEINSELKNQLKDVSKISSDKDVVINKKESEIHMIKVNFQKIQQQINKCDECEEVFKNYGDTKRHIRFHCGKNVDKKMESQKGQYQCFTCEFKTCSLSSLQSHETNCESV